MSDAYAVVAPAVKAAAAAAAPALGKAAGVAADVATVAAKAAAPLLRAAGGEIDAALTSAGLSPSTLTSAATTAGSKVDAAAAGAAGAASAGAAAGPVAVAQAAAGLVLAYVAAPPLVRALATRVRGFAGAISPAAALDAIVGSGDALLVDIRSAADKEAAGVPSLPAGARVVDVELAAVADRRLRASLRDVGAVERGVTALEIASLKRVGKGTTVLLLDRRGGDAKAVARELAARGFKRAFVVAGGFSAWAGARLPTKASAAAVRVEVLPALAALSAPRGGSQRVALPVPRAKAKALPRGGTQRQLPGGR